jgi:putative DNA primase/helicase
VAIELRTGLQRPPRREDYCTKAAAVAANDRGCPLWLEFLNRVTAGDVELQSYLQRVAGYCLTGMTTEHVLFFFFGSGANGKSVYLSTLRGIWNDYAVTAPMETFVESNSDRHPTEIAYLQGVRLVIAQETEQGRRWAESKIKSLTGGDPISARYMRQGFFEFKPQFKLLVAGNFKPSLRSVDEAIRRRFHLIPFTVTIPPEERDRHLAEKLKPEWGAILKKWAIDGCLEWQRIGLAPPKSVLDATQEYMHGEDALGRWIDDRCSLGKTMWAVGGELWKSWLAWCDLNKEPAGSQKNFSQEMQRRGFTLSRVNFARGFDGVALKQSEHDQ